MCRKFRYEFGERELFVRINDKVGDIFETVIKDLAYDGKAVGDIEGKIVFLNGGLPGERVRARIVRKKRQYSIGKVLDILGKSEDRSETTCPHFDICGGCTWQDLKYDKQLHFKRKQAVDCIERIGLLKDVEVAEVIGVEDPYYYRNKMEFSFNTVDGDEKFRLGLHKRGRFDEIFDIHECLLQSPGSNEMVCWFRDYVRENDLPVYDVLEHTGFVRFLMIREGKNTNQVMLNIITADGDIPDVDKFVASAVERFPQITTIVQNINDQKSNVAKGERENILYGPGYIEETILGYTFRIYANSFFQTNSVQAEILYSRAIELLGPSRDDRLLDLYCGAGTIGICASGQVGGIVGIESEPSSVQAARENAELNGIDNAVFHAGKAEKIFREEPEIISGVNCAIVDPPRAGFHPKALKKLIELDLGRVVYVSCNPATFSRDAAKMVEAGYRLEKVVPVDMFPHTMHIEVVAGFYK